MKFANNREEKLYQAAGAIGAVALLCGAMAGFGYWNQTHITTVTATVTGKERITEISGSDGETKTVVKNYVYTDLDTYRVKDSFWNGHFRAATVYASIPEKGTCELTLSGHRSGFLSLQQNIIAADCE